MSLGLCLKIHIVNRRLTRFRPQKPFEWVFVNRLDGFRPGAVKSGRQLRRGGLVGGGLRWALLSVAPPLRPTRYGGRPKPPHGATVPAPPHAQCLQHEPSDRCGTCRGPGARGGGCLIWHLMRHPRRACLAGLRSATHCHSRPHKLNPPTPHAPHDTQQGSIDRSTRTRHDGGRRCLQRPGPALGRARLDGGPEPERPRRGAGGGGDDR